jgi:hypothetical protein
MSTGTENEMTKEEMISEFQCSGCVCGGPTTDDCDVFEIQDEGNFFCTRHVPGTRVMPLRSGLLCLGLPKGFNRLSHQRGNSETAIRLHQDPPVSLWDNCNVPVWAMEKDGFLFVRTMAPRIDLCWIDVVEGGTIDMVPGALDVGTFIDEID